MFNKIEFSNILKRINSTYDTMSEFASRASFDRTYISKYINLKLDKAPSPSILQKIADASKGIVSYIDLMKICGYLTLDIKEELENKLALFNLTEEEYYDAINCFMNDSTYIQSLAFMLNFTPEVELTKETQVLATILEYVMSFIPEEITIPKDKEIMSNKEKYLETQQKFYAIFDKALSSAKKFLLSLDVHKITHKNNISNEAERYVLNLYKSLTPPNQKESINYMKYLKNKQNKSFDTLSETSDELFVLRSKIQVLGQTAAGKPIEYADEGTFSSNICNVPKGADYALIVNGDSMEPDIKNGSIIYIHTQEEVENGTIAIIEIDGAVTCKKVYLEKNQLKLVSLNPKYEPMIIDKGNVRILGKVIL